MTPDELDYRLLAELKKDSRRSVRQLAKSLDESPSTIYNRVKKLESKNIIKRWTVSLDYNQLDLNTTSFVLISTHAYLDGKKIDLLDIAKEISEIQGVYEVHMISGEFDLLVKIRGKNIQEVGGIVMTKIRGIKGVDKTQSNTVFDTMLCAQTDDTSQI